MIGYKKNPKRLFQKLFRNLKSNFTLRVLRVFQEKATVNYETDEIVE